LIQKNRLLNGPKFLSSQLLFLSINRIPKTLVLVPDLTLPGGVSNYYKTLELDAIGDINYFAITKAKPQSAFATTFRLLTNYTKFFIKLLKNRYEVVVVNPSLDEGKSFHRDLVFIIIAHILKRKTVVFFRGWFEPYEEKIKKSKLKSFLFRISYAKAGKYLVLGDIFKKKLIALGVPSETQFIIETTVADSSYINKLNLEHKYLTYKKEINFLFLSRIEKEKGIYIAIDAFKEFLNNSPQRKSSLIIAGDGPELPAVKAYVRNKKIPNIKFLGHVIGENKINVLLESHVMIFPSFSEGLPNAILEGMLYGMPIISRTTGGIPEVIQQNINGFLTESYDSSIFTNFLSLLASDFELYKNISEINHRIAMEKYITNKVRERILKIYQEF
jgi:glycosyltransferase involved in cell wall biosynthesis